MVIVENPSIRRKTVVIVTVSGPLVEKGTDCFSGNDVPLNSRPEGVRDFAFTRLLANRLNHTKSAVFNL